MEDRLEEKFQNVRKKETKLWMIQKSQLKMWLTYWTGLIQKFIEDLENEIGNWAEAVFEEVLAKKILSDLLKGTQFRKPNTEPWAGEIKRNLP